MTPAARKDALDRSVLDMDRIRRESRERERDREFDRHECHFFERHWWIGIALWLVYGLYIIVVRP